ncbi:MAG: hypothetical protein M4D80_38650 [Myxococcota bacterium]|nr:hypothetical protein [Deltaproteobacteria bacterium]MDQ3341115.1 hypothetical protein [Myxococcota bacterium]
MRIQLTLLLLAATQLGATDCGEVLRDPGFDLWCGDQLCSWKVVRGDAKRVDTWHEGDSGVELIGLDAAISQLSPVTSGDGTCIRFNFVANVESDVEASLNIDVYGDGKIEHPLAIPKSNWKPLTYTLHMGRPFTGIRFELAKKGRGRATFANIAAETVPVAECEGLTEIAPGPAPLGARCVADATCESGMCRLVDDPDSIFGQSLRCVACDATSCPAGDVCGVAEPISPVLLVPMRCEAAASSELGDLCATDAECATGICYGGACSTCNPTSAPCANGEACSLAWGFGPSVCSPGGARRTSGEACATDTDCTSGRCNGGLRKACSTDGRPCGNDTNCPVVDNSLTPGTCSTVGVTGGTCQ